MKYRVYLTNTASTSVEVEAENEDEAIDAAYEAPMPTICAQCSGWNRSWYLELSDEWQADEKNVEKVEP